MNTEIWRERDVLVTGATGFLGGWLVEALVSSGARVTALVRSPRSRSCLYLRGLDRRIKVLRSNDITDVSAIRTAIAERSTRIVFHLAGRATGPDSAGNDGYDVNVQGTRCVLAALGRTANPGAFVLASSLMVYRDSVGCGADETTTPHPANPYGQSKLAAEQLAFEMGRDLGVAVGALRLGNVYGSGDRNDSRLIPGVITSILSGRRPVLRDPFRSRRDYVHAADVRRAMLKLGAALLSGSLADETFNIATGRLARSIEVARSIARLCERPELVPAALDDEPSSTAFSGTATTKARRLLGWSAQVGLDAGLAETIDWYRADAMLEDEI